MPKRARCPHCDRLFDRSRLDDHIAKCRFRERKIHRESSRRRDVIVDGNNVAYFLSTDGRPRISNVLLAYRSLQSVGFRPTIVVSAALKHKINNPTTFQELKTTGTVVEARPGSNDDLLIIQLAQKKNADIVSNDRFLNWIDRFPWIPNRLKKYRMTTSGLILL